jgi:hypothetical protein
MLPVETYPIHDIVQQSTKRKIKFRPYLVKEEKLLLTAKEEYTQTKNVAVIFDVVKRIVKACCEDPIFTEQIDQIPLFDLEFFFINLRAISVNNVEKFTAIDTETGEPHDFQVNFLDVKVTFPDPKPDHRISLGKNLTMTMRYPSASIYDDSKLVEHIKKNDIFDLVCQCIDKIYDGDTIVPFKRNEIEKYVDNLSVKTYNKIREFLVNLPKLEYVQKYKNSKGSERELRLETLTDFFPYL